ncbi:Pfs, NACHT and Ankyrin domain protein [Beauveria brongniartii RCEF 3172]|uniref:Pfs, NACHT and Ankyrin domain protein n=1 Tax=Beauveria brongniartii RCEF 3172 TaxID=1081107 RepID=A0A167FCP6_9HYPO|nr:Pfs, NACHT and Ankyrin domain protein [Beauveria brongniartii RCEF 3172]
MASRKALDSPDAYVVAWIAALPIERASAEAMLDEEHAVPTGFTRHQTDVNVYTWGRIGEHNIVIASLPAGTYGTTSAATTASSLLASLPSIRVGLLVGIGRGIARPDEDHDIRLGDVVVSQPDGATGGVCQYDLIKAKSGDIRELTGFLGRPPTVLLHALASIQAEHERKDSKIPFFLQEMLKKNPKMGRKSKKNPGYCHQGFQNDRFFKSPSSHIPGPDCRGCDAADEVHREPRDTTDPDIHYGIIASGNTLIKDAAARERILTDVGKDCICFEMEAAGLMNHFPCLVIRGICDYADSHENDQWRRYASATAAAYAKELLAYVPAAHVQETKKALEVLRSEYVLTKTVQQQIDGVQHTMIETKAATDTVKSYLRADQIKSWLRPPDPSTNANHARTLRHEGTGTWLLGHPVFQSWLSGSCRHLWLHGLAGCGKTVLSATVLDHLSKEFSRLVLSFFFDFSDRKKQTVDGMLRSLAFQLYQRGPDSPGPLDASFQAHQDGRDQPTTSTLEDVVLKMLAIHKKGYIVLDALDEATAWGEVLQWMENVVSRPELGDVQLICTSRPESELSRRIPRFFGIKNCLPLDKQAVNADIRSWVTAQLSQRPDFLEKPLSHDLLDQIRREVGDGADGIFRWAFCQLDTLARCRHEAAMETALASLPISLGETYRRMIENIPRELAHDAIRLLQFLVHSEWPLELTQAKEIIATQIEIKSPRFDIKRRLFCETDILDYCPGLVTVVDAADKELHLAHFSVKEYLVGEHQFNITAASISITKTYLTYLTDINPSHGEVQLQRDFPMAMRAANVWTRCAVLAQDSEAIVRATTRFLKEEATFQRWARLCEPWKDHPSPPQGFGLYYACLFGLLATARDLIGNGASVSMQGGQFGNALQAASYGGHRDVIQLLLDKGADINEKGGKYGNALQAALSKGYRDIVQLLLDKGADINAQGGIHGNALQAASSYRGYRDIIQLLLDKGADINAQGGINQNALQAASYKGHQEIVQLLLDRGADINAQGYGGYHSNALQAASCACHKEIVQLLLDKGADVNTQGGYYGNALQAASIAGHQEIVQLLLNKGADVNAQGGVYGNALEAALDRGHQEILQLLVNKGAEAI